MSIPGPADPEVEWSQCLPLRTSMPHSLSTLERSNPPPRRKSCSACIKAKRRCTLESPACQRCAQRNIDCIYPNGRASRRRPPNASHNNAVTPMLVAGTLTPGWDLPVWNATCLGGLQPMQAEQHQLAPPGPNPASTVTMPCSLDGLDPVMEILDIPLNDLAHFPSEMPPLDTESELKKADDMAIEAHLAPPGTVSWFIQNRLQYAIDQMRTSPRQMVLENQTPWCHPCLYEHNMPRSLQDAYSSCALSMAKNTVNVNIILRSIESRAQELVTSPIPSNPFEALARTHALLLYQIIRIFDGDLSSDAAAEGTTQTLEDSAIALLDHIIFEATNTSAPDNFDGPYPSPSESDLPHSPPPSVTQAISPSTNPTSSPQAPRFRNPQADLSPDLPFYPLDATRTFWQTWVFQESARRTFIIAIFFVECYRALKGQPSDTCGGKLGSVWHSFTMSEPLWRARDPLNFAIAWRAGRRVIIENENFDEALSDASHVKPYDIDAFSKILMTSVKGINETKGWLLEAGGDL